jgi:hypothetical protein
MGAFPGNGGSPRVEKPRTVQGIQTYTKRRNLMKVTLDTTLGTLLDDPKAREILDKHAPGISSNPMVSMVRGMTLNNLLALPQAAQFGLTKEKAEQMLVEVNKQLGNP